MTLPIDKRYEIVFLSQHPMKPQLGEKAVAKAMKCATDAVQYWVNRWKKSKNQSDMKCSGRHRATAENIDQRIYKLATSDNIPG